MRDNGSISFLTFLFSSPEFFSSRAVSLDRSRQTSFDRNPKSNRVTELPDYIPVKESDKKGLALISIELYYTAIQTISY